jgi:hypothetical protein
MTDDTNEPLREHPASPSALEAALKALASAETFSPLDDRKPPRLDRSVKTEFLRRTIARAMSAKAQNRVFALRRMEPLLARQEAGGAIGPANGMLLGSIANAYPVSHSAMRRELRGLDAVGLIEIAEQIELRLWVAPYRSHNS